MAFHARDFQAGLPTAAKVAQGAMSFHAGQAAEDQVAARYARLGHDVLHTRWRGKRGEIDLVLMDGNGVILVEVKKSRDFATAAAHVTPAQARRLYATGEELLGTLPNGSLTDVRFDVALVNGCGEIEVIENAFAHMW